MKTEQTFIGLDHLRALAIGLVFLYLKFRRLVIAYCGTMLIFD
jgi:hypothetical protein